MTSSSPNPLTLRGSRVCLGVAILLVACGGNVQVRTQAAPDASFAGRSTFRFLPMPRTSAGALPGDIIDPMVDNSITNRALRDEIRSGLESRGYRAATDGTADLEVAFYASATQALDIRTYDYGYTWRRWPREYTEVTPYERGTVIVDIVDPSTHELLWRGQGVAAVSSDPNKFADAARKEVDAILKKFPAATGR
jgi:uncharacterized protein DUF4136